MQAFMLSFRKLCSISSLIIKVKDLKPGFEVNVIIIHFKGFPWCGGNKKYI